MDVHALIKEAGGPGKLAKRLGVAHNTVSDWRKAGFVPASRVPLIKAAFKLSAQEVMDLIEKVPMPCEAA